ncbi:hypothetical protein F2P81_019430 [Scophthalmus maximus]|uniref:Uncharacterized protein n=1 Tax=Scophthalmus maximus TaxID=52904 RepID=A0A6A4S1W3_SCOMX|nr:hypothetical protein F2P81_019430 [Scophthalmus maximus]
MMQSCRQRLLLLCLTAAVAMNMLGNTAVAAKEVAPQGVKNLTNMALSVIPHNVNSCVVTKLVIERNLITLNELDRQALRDERPKEPSFFPIIPILPQPDWTPVFGNTWKFTACVVALALTTSMLIVCAIKGPSWYKLFHNYRHRRLNQQEDDEDNFASTVFSEIERYHNHQTFTFEHQNGQTEEEEDGYFEDPYIRREE